MAPKLYGSTRLRYFSTNDAKNQKQISLKFSLRLGSIVAQFYPKSFCVNSFLGFEVNVAFVVSLQTLGLKSETDQCFRGLVNLICIQVNFQISNLRCAD